jgi:hypothetical protein
MILPGVPLARRPPGTAKGLAIVDSGGKLGEPAASSEDSLEVLQSRDKLRRGSVDFLDGI